jgi:hypothetical protein
MSFDPFKAIETSLGINPQATKIAVGGFIVMALAIGMAQFLDDDTLSFWHLLAALLALMVFMMAITHLPLMARRLMAWVLTLCFSFIALTATVQAVTNNRFTPPLSTVSCILSFYMAPSCSVSPPMVGSLDLALFGAAFAQDTTGPVGLAEARSRAIIFVQFAGYGRDDIVTLASALVEDGWPVEDAKRGGERIGSAQGLNEVRYFHPDDAAIAAALADATGAALAGATVIVEDLSASKYAMAAPGHLEIWVSR